MLLLVFLREKEKKKATKKAEFSKGRFSIGTILFHNPKSGRPRQSFVCVWGDGGGGGGDGGRRGRGRGGGVAIVFVTCNFARVFRG